MNSVTFTEGFRFLQFTFERSHYYDHRNKGCNRHFLAYMVSGYGKLVGQDPSVTIELSPGDVFYIPKGTKYQSFWHDKENIVYRSYAFQFLPKPDYQKYDMQKLALDEAAIARIRDIPTVNPANCQAIGAFYSALAAILPYMKSTAITPEELLCQNAISYMSKHPHASTEEVAHACQVSLSAVYAAFRHALGHSPNTQRQAILCDRAVELLTTTDRPIEEISEALGFSSSSYFRKVLHAHTGKSPREIRKSAHS